MKATFGAGCFWGVEDAFRHLKGVFSATSGYEGGHVSHPSYQQVCRGDTGHAEVVEIEYDPQKVSYQDLLRLFWEIHDPTTYHRQGPDVGEQYRSVIFYHNEEQKALALASLKEESSRHKHKIVTEILPAKGFYRAEEYHQRYLEKQGRSSCIVRKKHDLP